MSEGHRIIEARWEAFADAGFFEVETICGDLAAAQGIATLFLLKYNRRAKALLWLEGEPDENGSVYYGSDPNVTFRVRQ